MTLPIPIKAKQTWRGYPAKLSPGEVGHRFRRVLGAFERPSVPLRLKVTDERLLKGGIVRQRVEYDVDRGERISAYHLFKKGLGAEAPGVLSIHGHGGEDIFPVGKAFHCHPVKDDPLQYSYLAARAGFRVLAPDALCFGERQARWGYSTLFFDEIATQSELTGQGKSLAWKSVWDNSRAIEALETLGCRSVGAMGWSGGSTQAYILASVNRKVLASACFFSFMTLRRQFGQYRCCHCLYHYIPGMMKAGLDWDQVVALIPPRKIFMGWGARDAGSPEPMYRSFVKAIRAQEKKASVRCLRLYEEPEKGHEITLPMMDAALSFLKRSLGER